MAKFTMIRKQAWQPARLPEAPTGENEAIVQISARRARESVQLSWTQTPGLHRAKTYARILRPILIFTFLYSLFCWYWFHYHLPMNSFPLVLFCLYLPMYILLIWQLLYRPSHIELRKHGFRFHRLYPWGLKSSAWLPWNTVLYASSSEEDATFSKYKCKCLDLRLARGSVKMLDRLFILGHTYPILRILHRDAWVGDYHYRLNRDFVTLEEDVEKIAKAVSAFVEPERVDPSIDDWLVKEQEEVSVTSLWLDKLSDLSTKLDPLSPGVRVSEGRYEVAERLSSGGQAITYKAFDLNSSNGSGKNLVVVLKEFVLPVRGGREVTGRAVENIKKEASLIKQLDHPQIVRCLDTFFEGRKAYLVFNFIEGSTLRQLVESKGKLGESECIALAIQMCEIIEYLHRRTPPVVHRDFTPDNLMLRTDGKLELIDFNVAKQLESASATQTVVGKHAYIPPEQFRGHATTQSDIYALGCTIFYLLTGEDPEAISVSHPKTLVKELSDELNALVAKATSQDPPGRFQDAKEMRSEFERTAASRVQANR
jgi:hypothetical protein